MRYTPASGLNRCMGGRQEIRGGVGGQSQGGRISSLLIMMVHAVMRWSSIHARIWFGLIRRGRFGPLKAIMRLMKFLKIGLVVAVCAAAGMGALLIVSDRMSQPKPPDRATLRIATAIPLPVDLLWPEWICGRLQNCFGIGRFRWSCAIHISLRNTGHRL